MTKRACKIVFFTLLIYIHNSLVSYAQDIFANTISLNLKNTKIEEVLNVISEETGIIFTYSSSYIPINRRVNIKATNKNLRKVVDQILAPYCANIEYLISNNRVIIKAEKKVFADAKEQYGIVSGYLIDKENFEALPGASIFIPAYNKGAITSENGTFKLPDLPIGKHTLEVHYIGYKPATKYIELKKDSLFLTIELERDLTYLNEIMVLGQLDGQQLAIKEQQQNPTIVNIVSKDKIGQLPDQNAAEAVGRLPGVSVIRNGGEGQHIVLRGVSPRLSAITINGERIPSTSIQERTVDLTMLSPDLLSGLEIFKAITPDQDADATGGIINFTIKKAVKADWEAVFTGQYGYNSHQNTFGQYKINFNLGKRFFSKKLGFLISGNLQEADRSSDAFEASIRFKEVDETGNPRYAYADLSLNDRLEKRYRYGGSLVLDYALSDKSFLEYYGVFSRVDRFETKRRRRYQVEDSRQE
ncbi:MAG: carboxypeptidase-like regulatory domain-containing protein, partial [Bacteroidota bacterium]